MSTKNGLRTALYTGLAALTIASCGGPPKPEWYPPEPTVPIKECKGREPYWFLHPERWFETPGKSGKETEKRRESPEKGQEEHYLFGFGAGVSLDLETALEKAEDNSRISLIQQHETYAERVMNQLRQETGVSSNALLRIFSSGFTHGSGVQRKYQRCEDEEMHRVYMGLAEPIGLTAEQWIGEIGKNADLHKILQDSRTYKELLKQQDWFRGFREGQ